MQPIRHSLEKCPYVVGVEDMVAMVAVTAEREVEGVETEETEETEAGVVLCRALHMPGVWNQTKP